MNYFQKIFMNLIDIYTANRSDTYIEKLYRKMHQDGEFGGRTWENSYDKFLDTITSIESKNTLDFGCGPNGGISAHLDNVIPYDPYVDQFSDSPWGKPIDVIHSADVLEHLTQKQLANFCQNVNRSTAKELFFVVSTRKAVKRLPNGANAHATIKSGKWWLRFFKNNLPEFVPMYATDDLLKKQLFLYYSK